MTLEDKAMDCPEPVVHRLSHTGGVDADGLPIRWSFSEMKSDSFHWQGEKSHDGGKTWKVEEDHHMKRRSA